MDIKGQLSFCVRNGLIVTASHLRYPKRSSFVCELGVFERRVNGCVRCEGFFYVSMPIIRFAQFCFRFKMLKKEENNNIFLQLEEKLKDIF